MANKLVEDFLKGLLLSELALTHRVVRVELFPKVAQLSAERVFE
jgi:hypothetical protein